MPKVIADGGLCQGHANCIMDAGEIFDLDEDGLVVVLKEEITEDERAQVETAIANCPVSALSLAEE
jgi:ferredoxin